MEKPQYVYKAPNHVANLNEMRLKDKWCDVTIKVNKKEIRAHKVILAANLKYFDTMLSNDSFQESKEGVITMESVEEEDLEAFVSYAYTGEILLTDSNALNLLELANYLSEDGIKQACIKFLEYHLKAEGACRAYQFANALGLLTLKNLAKVKIVINFEDCSKRKDYLDFDYESLKDILSSGKALSVELQQTLFEGIIKWIVHDTKSRKIHLRDLLSLIDLARLPIRDVIGYLYENTDRCDENEIIKHTMSYYFPSENESQKSEKTLMIVDLEDNDHYSTLMLKCYSFAENKWMPKQPILNFKGYHSSNVVFVNDELYFTVTETRETCFYKYNLTIKQSKKILNSSEKILDSSALCACSRYVYLCGGLSPYGGSSNQVLKYDTRTEKFETMNPMAQSRFEATAIVYKDYLYVLGGVCTQDDGYEPLDPTGIRSVEKYDLVTREWTPAAMMHTRHFQHAVAVLDGKLYACGGSGDNWKSIEAYDPLTNSWQLGAQRNSTEYCSSMVVHEGKLWAFGKVWVGIYDPNKNEWKTYMYYLGLHQPRGASILPSFLIADK